MLQETLTLATPLVKRFEGFRSKPYRCSAGVWTIGYGTTLIDGRPVSPETPECSESEADFWMQAELERLVRKLLKTNSISTPEQLAALASFAYNLGIGALLSSTLWRLHKAGRFEEAAQQFGRWVNAGGRRLAGLVLRRSAEASLYLSRTQDS